MTNKQKITRAFKSKAQRKTASFFALRNMFAKKMVPNGEIGRVIRDKRWI